MKDIKTYIILFLLFLVVIFLGLWRCDRPKPMAQKSPTDSLKGVIRIKDNEIAILRAKISRQVVKNEEIKKEAIKLPRIKDVPVVRGDSAIREVATEKERLLDESLSNFDSTLELVAIEHRQIEAKDSLVRRVFAIDSTTIKAQEKEIATLKRKVSRRDFWLKMEVAIILVITGWAAAMASN